MIFNISNSGNAGNLVHLHVSYDPSLAGATITATNGSEVHTAKANESGLTIISGSKLGEWVIELDGNSVTVDTTFYGNYEVGAAKPEGSTVTPVNDIQIWLKCAEINKSYTTINQVIADTATLSTLISDNNAVDYMARSTGWANSVAADQTAMTYIGNNDYCANKLLDNSTWLTAICNSTYFERVLNVKVPTMTSATNPSGEVFDSGHNDGYEGYKAFDGITNDYNNCWHASSANATLPQSLGYDFRKKVKVSFVVVMNRHLTAPSTQNTNAPKDVILQGSNDGYTWDDIASYTNQNKNNEGKWSFNAIPSKAYSKYRLQCLSNLIEPTRQYVAINALQFYGREEA